MSTIKALLQNGVQRIRSSKSPELDAEVLLAHVLQRPREHVIAHHEESVPAKDEARFLAFIRERAKHAPIAYLIGQKDFYGRTFYVTKNVHIPRPETEDLIDQIAQELPADFKGTIADIGTGSGVIAITCANIFPHANIIATDVSDRALAVAKKNASTHVVAGRITFLHGSLLEPIDTGVDLLLANLPYGWIDEAGSWTHDSETLSQPARVYDGGAGGLALIAGCIHDLDRVLCANGRAYFEFDPRQTRMLQNISTALGYCPTVLRDAGARDRFLVLEKK